ncbi:unnamed protein product [Pieris macdunnoughi]|uniref:Uncharacterized protein n=1 Tax=Pieris macdunnoughi TaxID=345717 RepID=A0A821MPD3_9NEOP|nr:unnamed protein product [Pieris macdunnoughi]
MDSVMRHLIPIGGLPGFNAPLGKAAAAFRQQTAGVSRHVLPKATRLVSRSLPLQLSTRGSHASSVTTNRPTHSQQPVHRKTGSEKSQMTHTNSPAEVVVSADSVLWIKADTK